MEKEDLLKYLELYYPNFSSLSKDELNYKYYRIMHKLKKIFEKQILTIKEIEYVEKKTFIMYLLEDFLH